VASRPKVAPTKADFCTAFTLCMDPPRLPQR
jgi:hypothetical protein